MVKNDIYNNQARYEKLKDRLGSIHIPPDPTGKSVYYVKNKANVAYFYKLIERQEGKDTSYVRRLRLLQTLKLVCYATEKDLKDLTRQDIDQICAFMHTRYNSSKSKRDFILDVRNMWRLFFPETDEKGRPDESITPYAVRHLSAKQDKANQTARNDKISWKEFTSIIDYFGDKPHIQAYLMLAMESLGRPQEILYRKIKDVETYDNYGKIQLSDHGKEGIGILQCIDSYPHLLRWLKVHPCKNDPESWLFCNVKHKKGSQLTPYTINKLLTTACKNLNISKSITCYSIKRNGVTFRRLRGDSDATIQHVARWTSTRQLKTYDLSSQEDIFRKELIKRGLLEPAKNEMQHIQRPKICLFCDKTNPYDKIVCDGCKRPLDRRKIRQEAEIKEQHYERLNAEIAALRQEMRTRNEHDDDLDFFFKQPEAQEFFRLIVHKLKKRIPKTVKIY